MGRGGGGSDRGSFFIAIKITTSEFVYPKKSLLFYNTPKNPLILFWQPKKSLCFLFRNPKKSRRIPKAQKNHFGPKFQTQKITRTPSPIIKIKSGPPWTNGQQIWSSILMWTLANTSLLTYFLVLLANMYKLCHRLSQVGLLDQFPFHKWLAPFECTLYTVSVTAISNNIYFVTHILYAV